MVRLTSKIIFNCIVFQTKGLSKKAIQICDAFQTENNPQVRKLKKRNNQLRFAGKITHEES